VGSGGGVGEREREKKERRKRGHVEKGGVLIDEGKQREKEDGG
jgi:hypothetical protein